MLVQIGLLDKSKLPVTGAEQAARLLDPSLPVQHADPEGLTRFSSACALACGEARRLLWLCRASAETCALMTAAGRRLKKALQPCGMRPAPQPSATQ